MKKADRRRIATALRAAADVLARGELSSDVHDFMIEHSEKANAVRADILDYRFFVQKAASNPKLPKALRRVAKKAASTAFQEEQQWEEMQKAPHSSMRK